MYLLVCHDVRHPAQVLISHNHIIIDLGTDILPK